MPAQPTDTEPLHRALMLMIYLFLGLIAALFIFLSLGDTIQRKLSKPEYTNEELLARTEERKAMLYRSKYENADLIEDGVHVRTGLKADEHLNTVIGSCTSCHSAKLITQNRATREGWKQMIDWMEETQGLANLGRSEGKILDYLAKHYAPVNVGRRQNIDMEAIKWYVLDLEED